ncbi:hypothetical protein [Rossellomorea vietnamensis]|uniref:hypothetical protein n=1 Tax=Rossellomorea vietnamensis TaxID=218284 RepID=UPI001653BA3D|nr:hypothetical protein [Rossellomorea vietnamensis]
MKKQSQENYNMSRQKKKVPFFTGALQICLSLDGIHHPFLKVAWQEWESIP